MNSKPTGDLPPAADALPSADIPTTGGSSPASAQPVGEAVRCWLRLANLQFSPRLLAQLLAHFEQDVEAIFAASDRDLDEAPSFTSRHLVRLRDPANEATARQVRWFERYGVRLITTGHPEYPDLLSSIPDPPPFLFVRGSLVDPDGHRIGIVGSRHATPYGRGVAERLARELAAHGVTVVSGGAVGVDAAAHRGVLHAGGRTIAVLGCGLDVDYPREHRDLFERIAATGALVSEYPLGAQPESWRFPARNRIISGMASGILVVEAPLKSGALITARCAVEQGRVLLTVPGNIDRPGSAGSNELLRDGATPALCTEDILQALDLIVVPARHEAQGAFDLGDEGRSHHLPILPKNGIVAPPADPSPDLERGTVLPPLPELQEKLLRCLSQTPQHIDPLARQAEITVGQAAVELTLLELDGLVRRLPGNTYIRTI